MDKKASMIREILFVVSLIYCPRLMFRSSRWVGDMPLSHARLSRAWQRWALLSGRMPYCPESCDDA